MPQYIDKSALVAGIERRIKELRDLFKEDEKKLDSFQKTAINLCIDECKVVLDILDTLEVKEVDLENYVKGRIDYPLIGYDFPNIYPNYKELKFYCDKNGIKDEDKVKIIIMKENNKI